MLSAPGAGACPLQNQQAVAPQFSKPQIFPGGRGRGAFAAGRGRSKPVCSGEAPQHTTAASFPNEHGARNKALKLLQMLATATALFLALLSPQPMIFSRQGHPKRTSKLFHPHKERAIREKCSCLAKKRLQVGGLFLYKSPHRAVAILPRRSSLLALPPWRCQKLRNPR